MESVAEIAYTDTVKWSFRDCVLLVQRGESQVEEKLNEPKLKMGQLWNTFMPCFKVGSTSLRQNSSFGLYQASVQCFVFFFMFFLMKRGNCGGHNL